MEKVFEAELQDKDMEGHGLGRGCASLKHGLCISSGM